VTFLAQRFDANGNMIGSIKVRESATLDKTGDTYGGSGKFEMRDLQGNPILGTSKSYRTALYE